MSKAVLAARLSVSEREPPVHLLYLGLLWKVWRAAQLLRIVPMQRLAIHSIGLIFVSLRTNQRRHHHARGMRMHSCVIGATKPAGKKLTNHHRTVQSRSLEEFNQHYRSMAATAATSSPQRPPRSVPEFVSEAYQAGACEVHVLGTPATLEARAARALTRARG